MEQNTEIKTLSFSKGMTTIPSDLLSDDSELLESDGYIYKDGEMKPIQKPVCITGNAPLEGKLVYVHKLADYRNLITYIEKSRTVNCYLRFQEGDITGRQMQSVKLNSKLLDIKHVGNTLVCATDDGMHYILYTGNEYKDLGTELPKPDVSFSFSAEAEKTVPENGRTVCQINKFVSVDHNNSGWSCYDDAGNFLSVRDNHDGVNLYSTNYHHTINDGTENYNNFQAAVKGHVAEAIEYTKKNNLFAFPFFIRTALRLFDGTTFVRISNPIICYPSSQKNCKFGPCVYNSEKGIWEIRYNEVDAPNYGWNYLLTLNYAHLNFKVEIPHKDDWADIIKEFVVFASDNVLPFELDSDWSFKAVSDVSGKRYYDGVVDGGYLTKDIVFNWNTYHARELIEPVYKTERKMMNELMDKSQFFKLFSLELDSAYLDGKWHDASAYDATVSDVRIMPEGTLSNLKEQEQLSVDDYYGWAHLVPQRLFAYNNRLNSFGVKRFPFEGFNKFLAVEDNAPVGEYYYLVHIVSSTMNRWVKSDYSPYHGSASLCGWLYYPDPNAKEIIVAQIFSSVGVLYKLTPHPFLNGAYSFTSMATSITPYPTTALPDVDLNGYESFDSQIFTSVVNNPFSFQASGDNTVGTGKILGIVANTEAISQGQFGQYPLLVFTDEGLYGLSVNAEGLYSAAYPISREVCGDDSPLVPTDRLVFFVSKKGLMAVSGGSVACMSEQMRGRAPLNFSTLGDGKFLDFLEGCLIAYDYRDSLLRIYGEGKSYQYIYNMVDRTFSMVNSGLSAQAVVNDYPDNLVQDTAGNVYTLTGKPDVNEDSNLYSGSFTTRPLKLGGSMVLKSLRDIRNLKTTQTGKLSLEVWGSNNAVNWCKLRSLFGKPWAFFTFRYTLSGFKASDSFQGSVVVVQNRRSLLSGQQ